MLLPTREGGPEPVLQTLWLKKKSLFRSTSESLGWGYTSTEVSRDACRKGQEVVLEGFKREALLQQGLSLLLLQLQVPQVSINTACQLKGALWCLSPQAPQRLSSGSGASLSSQINRPVRNCSPAGATESQNHGRALYPSSIPSPRDPLMWCLLTGHPQGAELIRNWFPQTTQKQSLGTSHPRNLVTWSSEAPFQGPRGPGQKQRFSSTRVLLTCSFLPPALLALTSRNKGAFLPAPQSHRIFVRPVLVFLPLGPILAGLPRHHRALETNPVLFPRT